jgi:hypothetical protein
MAPGHGLGVAFRPAIRLSTSSVFSAELSRGSCAPSNFHLYGGGEPTGPAAKKRKVTFSLLYVIHFVTNGGRGLSYSVESMTSGFPYFAITASGAIEGNSPENAGAVRKAKTIDTTTGTVFIGVSWLLGRLYRLRPRPQAGNTPLARPRGPFVSLPS